MNRALIAAGAAGVAVTLGAAVLVLRTRFVSVTVQGESMEPTLRTGDRVLVRRVPLSRVRRGQVVVLAPPGGPSGWPDDPPWMVKRVAALPGDAVPSQVPVPGDAADRRVPPGMFVVLGDNAARSYDSRRAGYFPADALLGVVVRPALT